MHKQDDRSYVVAFTKQNTELDRGWLPTYCLTLKTEAVEITSKEGTSIKGVFQRNTRLGSSPGYRTTKI